MKFIKSHLWVILLTLVIILPVFAHLTDMPVELWDESRLANNAFEMLQTGNLWVTTYDYRPDMWNTKPPLMIWLMSLSMKVFGTGELGIRMPSALAAICTFFLVFWFTNKTSGNKRTAFIAAFVLVTTGGYVKLHGTRTGDYDALLAFFTTAYIFMYFLYLQTDKGKYLLWFFIYIAGAILTKGIAGFFFLPALFIYTLIQRRLKNIFISRYFYIGLGVFLILTVGYYLLREHYNPGYIAAVMENEIGGRFGTVIEGHSGGPMFYVTLLSTAHFTFWIMLFSLGIVIGVLSADKAMQNLTIYLSLVVVIFYLVLSASESKLYWYDLPVFPIMAVVTSIGVSYIISYVSMHSLAGKKAKGIAYAAILIFIFCLPYYSIIDFVLSPHTGSDENSSMALYMKSVREGKRQIDGYLFTNDSKTDQNINYYLKIHPTKLPYKDVNDLIPSDKVIIFSPSIKEHINKNYDFEIVESIGDVKVCQIIKIKSQVSTL